MPETRIDLLRHGQCEGGEIFRGSTDVALSPEGWAIMRARLEQCSPSPWQRVISSPLQRCQHFARETAQRLALPLVLEPDLREIHFGDWEGRDQLELWRTDPHLRRWAEDPEAHPPPKGEPLGVFSERVLAVLKRIARAHSGEHLLVVTHGGVIRLLLSWVQGLARRDLGHLPVPYGHFAQLLWQDGQFQLLDGQGNGSYEAHERFDGYKGTSA